MLIYIILVVAAVAYFILKGNEEVNKVPNLEETAHNEEVPPTNAEAPPTTAVAPPTTVPLKKEPVATTSVKPSKVLVLGSFTPSQVLTDVASFMDIDDAVKFSMISPGANYVLNSHRALARKFSQITVLSDEIRVTASDNAKGRSLPLDSNVELAQKQVASFMKTVNEVTGIEWNYFDVDDKIANEFRRINLTKDVKWKYINIIGCRLTASLDNTLRFLAKHPQKVKLEGVFVSPSIVINKIISLLNTEITIAPLGTNDVQISTPITDELLQYPFFLEDFCLNLLGFLHLNLSFAAILKLSKVIIAKPVRDYYLKIGIIGYQEMPAILHCYRNERSAYWKLTLCNWYNNSTFLQFTKMESEYGDKHFVVGISLERDKYGLVDNAVIPEELVDVKIFQKFKELVKDLDSKTPIESIVSNRIRMGELRVMYDEKVATSLLVIRAEICQEPNARIERSQKSEIVRQNLDQTITEKILVRLFKSCCTISSLDLTVRNDEKADSLIKLTDSLFTSLLEHAHATQVEEEWSMDIQLSAENMARLRENRTTGLFQKLKIEPNVIERAVTVQPSVSVASEQDD